MANLFNPEKRVKFNLVGKDGNAFFLLGAWVREARKAKWAHDDVKLVMETAMSGDYSNLLVTLMDHSK